jgi:hypothetical protein
MIQKKAFSEIAITGMPPIKYLKKNGVGANGFAKYTEDSCTAGQQYVDLATQKGITIRKDGWTLAVSKTLHTPAFWYKEI